MTGSFWAHSASQGAEPVLGAPDRARAVTHADVALSGSSMPIDVLTRIAGLAVEAPLGLAT